MNAHDHAIDHSLNAERAVLGGIFVDSTRWDDAANILSRDDWFRQAHGILWGAISRLIEQGKPLDPLTVQSVLSPKELEDAGGPAYLFRLLEGVPRSSNVAAYAAQVKESAQRRRLEALGRSISSQAQSGEVTATDVLDRAEGELLRLRTAYENGTGRPAPSRGARAIERLEHAAQGRRPGVMSGIVGLDSMTFGFRPGQLIVVGARPANGKTALALQLARQAQSTVPVLFASLEMPEDELTDRNWAASAGVPFHVIQTGRPSESEMQRLSAAAHLIDSENLEIIDRAGVTVAQIRSRARVFAARRAQPLGLIVVDYLQLMRPEPGTRTENRTVEVSQISAGLKRLARDLNVPVIALAQLSRESERRPNKRPMSSDLRESGALEQDADVVLLLHRPCLYDDNQPKDITELIIAKQRNGPTGIALLKFHAETMSFSDNRGRP